MDTLGDGYAKDDLIAVIAGTRKHIPRKVPVRTDEPKKLGLVIDIQRKLQEGKGAGYSKKFYAAHESDILIHKAAKQAFDELKLEKLPTVKTLQERYANFCI